MDNYLRNYAMFMGGAIACITGGLFAITNLSSNPNKDHSVFFYNPPPIIQSVYDIDDKIYVLQKTYLHNMAYYARYADSLESRDQNLETTIKKSIEEKVRALNSDRDSLTDLPDYNPAKIENAVGFNRQRTKNIFAGTLLFILGLGVPLLEYPERLKRINRTEEENEKHCK